MHTEESFRRRRLPHWDVPGAIYFVTACLEGSIPAEGLLDLTRYRQQLERRPRPSEMGERQWQDHKWKLRFAQSDDWLDRRPGVRHFADARLARIAVTAIYYFAGARYDLLAYVVMPSHLHWVFRPLEAWTQGLGPSANVRPPRERIMHGLKRHTGLECNRLLGCQGPFWQDESYDHCVFDVDELERIMDYVEWNPVRAGLVTSPDEWLFSSARDRAAGNIPLGQRLCRGAGFQPAEGAGQVVNLPHEAEGQ
jgi:type I restriction enzyme R subunit